MTASIRPSRLTWSATSRVWSRSARSPATATAPWSRRSVTAASRCRLRAWTTTSCPSSSRAWAVARPRPSAEPVTKTRATGRLAVVGGGRGRIGGRGLVGGRPAGQELEAVLGRCAGFGGVDGQRQLPVVGGGQVQGVVDQLEGADGGVAELFGPGVVDAHVVRGPAGAELLADGGQLPDQFAQVLAVGVAAGLGAQQRDGDVGRALPVGVVAARPRVEELETGEVRRPARVVEHR